jgi:hypothetical protein
MIRTAASVTISAALFAVFASSSACSSSSTNDDKEKGGTGTIVGAAGSSTSGSGGVGNTTGGTRSDAGTTSTAGTGTGLCAGKERKCIDADTLQACDPDTGEDLVVKCGEEFAKLHLISNGCTGEGAASGCSLDGGENQECWLGSQGIGVCDMLTNQEALDAYLACFDEDPPEARTVVTCVADFVDEATKTVDCMGAIAACGDQGTGGAAPDGVGGAPDGSGGVGGAQ